MGSETVKQRRFSGGWRPAATVAMIGGFYVLLPALPAAGVALVWTAHVHGWPVQLALALAAGPVWAVVGTLRALFSSDPPEAGLRLERDRAPELWRMVDELAAAAETRAPDEILLVPEVNAGVTEQGNWLGLRPGVRRLYLGAPLLACLTAGELRATLGHELGHFSGRHTAWSAAGYRTVAGMEAAGSTGGPAGLLLRGWLWLYLKVAMPLSRQWELEADAVSLDAAGRTAAVSALRREAALRHLEDDYAHAWFPLAILARRTPDLIGGLHAYLGAPGRAAEVAALAAQDTLGALEPETGAWYSTHPPLDERIALLQRLPAPEVAADDRPAAVLLPDLAGAVAELGRSLVEELSAASGPEEPVADWAQIVERAAAVRVQLSAARHTHRLEESGVLARADLASVLAAVESGRGAELAAPEPSWQEDDNASAGRRTGSAVVLAVLAEAAVLATGRGGYRLDWSGPPALLVDGVPAGLGEAAARAAADPAAVPELRRRLAELGAPPDHRPDRAAFDFPDEILTVFGNVALRHRTYDLVICTHGLLLLRRGVFRLAVGQQRRLARLQARGRTALHARRHARAIPVETLSSIRLVGADSAKLDLRLTDGSTLRLRTTAESVGDGPVDVLRALVADPPAVALLGEPAAP
ncbi:M48 family metallopeptidase [Peterkaempfera bronchialis]|nr:M48 family metallopeptidase [Peterkaempfera bronchialis]